MGATMELMGATLLGAASVAFIHTAVGVDHYLPFIVLGRAERWPLRKTLLWTMACGVGHLASSVLLALGAAALGVATGTLGGVESLRGDAAALLLIIFGCVYAAMGLVFRRGHSHLHVHDDGTVHDHSHRHADGLVHDHHGIGHLASHRRTLWTVFIIFFLGPCEPLMAFLFAPGLNQSWVMASAVVALFSLITLATMLGFVVLGSLGLNVMRLSALDRWNRSLAGLAVALSGALILFGM